MIVLEWFVHIFLAPGDIVRRRLHITIEEDGGLIRSFINMCVWGAIGLIAALYFFY